jgi:hypothetical protein
VPSHRTQWHRSPDKPTIRSQCAEDLVLLPVWRACKCRQSSSLSTKQVLAAQMRSDVTGEPSLSFDTERCPGWRSATQLSQSHAAVAHSILLGTREGVLVSALGPCCNRSRVGRCRVLIGYRCRCNLVGCRIVCGRTTVPARHEAVTRRRELRQLFHAPQRRDMQYSVLRHGNAEHLGEQIGNDLQSQCAQPSGRRGR